MYASYSTSELLECQVRIFDKDNVHRYFDFDDVSPRGLAVVEEKKCKKVFMVGIRPNAKFVVKVNEICDRQLPGKEFVRDGYENVKKHHSSRWPFYGACGAAYANATRSSSARIQCRGRLSTQV